MGHSVIPEISKRSRWWIPKYRFLELKYFCLQYPEWKREAAELIRRNSGVIQNEIKKQVEFSDPTGDMAIRLGCLNSKIALVEEIGFTVDKEIGEYVLKAVTEGVSFIKLKTLYEIPCERDMYYDRYRKFFYLLDKMRG